MYKSAHESGIKATSAAMHVYVHDTHATDFLVAKLLIYQQWSSVVNSALRMIWYTYVCVSVCACVCMCVCVCVCVCVCAYVYV